MNYNDFETNESLLESIANNTPEDYTSITGNVLQDAILNTDSVSPIYKKAFEASLNLETKKALTDQLGLKKEVNLNGYQVVKIKWSDGDSYIGETSDGREVKGRFSSPLHFDIVDKRVKANQSAYKKLHQPEFVSNITGAQEPNDQEWENVKNYQQNEMIRGFTEKNYKFNPYDPLKHYTHDDREFEIAVKQVGTDEYGRPLVDAINLSTGRSVAFDASINPYLNASFSLYDSLDTKHNREKLNNYLVQKDQLYKYIADGYDHDSRIGELIDLAQSSLYRMTGRILSRLPEKAETGIFGIDRNKWKAIAEEESGQELADFWAGVKHQTRRSYAKGMLEASKDWDNGNYFDAIVGWASQADKLLADSASTALLGIPGSLIGTAIVGAAGITGLPAAALVALAASITGSVDNTLMTMEQYKYNNNGKEMSKDDIAKAYGFYVATNIPGEFLKGINFTKLLPKSVSKYVVPTALHDPILHLPKVKSVIGGGAEEFGQEYLEDTADTYFAQNEKYKQPFMDVLTDPERLKSGIVGAVTGTVTSGVSNTASTLKTSLSNHINKVTQEDIQTVTSKVAYNPNEVVDEKASSDAFKVFKAKVEEADKNTDKMTSLSTIVDAVDELRKTKGLTAKDQDEASSTALVKIVAANKSSEITDEQKDALINRVKSDPNFSIVRGLNPEESDTSLTREEELFALAVINKLKKGENLTTDEEEAIRAWGKRLGINEDTQNELIGSSRSFVKQQNDNYKAMRDSTDKSGIIHTNEEIFKKNFNRNARDYSIATNKNATPEARAKSQSNLKKHGDISIKKFRASVKAITKLANSTDVNINAVDEDGKHVFSFDRTKLSGTTISDPGNGAFGTVLKMLNEAKGAYTQYFNTLEETPEIKTQKETIFKELEDLETEVYASMNKLVAEKTPSTTVKNSTNSESTTNESKKEESNKNTSTTVKNTEGPISPEIVEDEKSKPKVKITPTVHAASLITHVTNIIRGSISTNTKNTELAVTRTKGMVKAVVNLLKKKETTVNDMINEIEQSNNYSDGQKEELLRVINIIKEHQNDEDLFNKIEAAIENTYKDITYSQKRALEDKLDYIKNPKQKAKVIKAIKELEERLVKISENNTGTVFRNRRNFIKFVNKHMVSKQQSDRAKSFLNTIITLMTKVKASSGFTGIRNAIGKNLSRIAAIAQNIKLNAFNANTTLLNGNPIKALSSDGTDTWVEKIPALVNKLLVADFERSEDFLQECIHNPALALLFDITVKDDEVSIKFNKEMALALDLTVREFFSTKQNLNRIYPQSAADAVASYGLDDNLLNDNQREGIYNFAKANGVPISNIATSLGLLFAKNIGLGTNDNAPLDTRNKLIAAVGAYAIRYASSNLLTSMNGANFNNSIINIKKNVLVPAKYLTTDSDQVVDTVVLNPAITEGTADRVYTSNEVNMIKNAFSKISKANSWVVFDFETAGPLNSDGGPDKGAAEIRQASIIEYNKDGTIKNQYEIILEKGKYEVSKTFTKNGKSIENPMYKYLKKKEYEKNRTADSPELHVLSRAEGLKKIASLLANKVVVGHNIKGFDLEVLKQNLNNEGLGDLYNTLNTEDEVDTLEIARVMFPYLPSRSLGDLHTYFTGSQDVASTELNRAHNATFDTKMNETVLENMLAITNRLTEGQKSKTSIRYQLRWDNQVLDRFRIKSDIDEQIYLSKDEVKHEVPYSVRKTRGTNKLPYKSREFIKNVDEVPYSFTSRDLLDKILENIIELKKSLGFKEFVDLAKLPRSLRDAARSRNEEIEREIAGLQYLYELPDEESSIYLSNFIGRNSRLYMEGTYINPQTMKLLQRFLVAPNAQKVTYKIHSDDFDADFNEKNVRFAIEQTFDVLKKNEEGEPDKTVNAVKLKLQSSRAELNKLLTEVIKSDEKGIKKLFGVDYLESKSQLMTLIQFFIDRATAIEGRKTSFEGYLPVEVDSTSSGIFIKTMQFPRFIQRIAAAVGIVLKSADPKVQEARTAHDLRRNGVEDSYMLPMKEEFFEPSDTATILDRKNGTTEIKYTKIFPAITTLGNDIIIKFNNILQDIADITGGVDQKDLSKKKKLRGLFKYPTMYNIYTAGRKTVAHNLSAELLDEYIGLYAEYNGVKLEDIKDDSIRNKVNSIRTLETLYYAKNNPSLNAETFYEAIMHHPLTNIMLAGSENAETKYNVREMFADIIGTTIGADMYNAIDKAYDYKEENGFLKNVAIVKFYAFKKKLQKAIDDKIKKSNRDYITVDEYNDIVSKIDKEHLLPTVESIFKKEASGAFFAKPTSVEDTKSQVSITTPNLSNKQNNTTYVYANIEEFSAPRQQGAVIPIHMLDSFQAEMIRKIQANITCIFDALILNTDMHTVGSKLYNKAGFLINMQYNLGEVMLNNLKISIQEFYRQEANKDISYDEWAKSLKLKFVLSSSENVELDSEVQDLSIADVIAKYEKLVADNNEQRKQVYGYFNEETHQFIPGEITRIINMDGAEGSAFDISEFINEINSNDNIKTLDDFNKYVQNIIEGNDTSVEATKLRELGNFETKEQEEVAANAHHESSSIHGLHPGKTYISTQEMKNLGIQANESVEARKKLVDSLLEIDKENGIIVDSAYISELMEILDIADPSTITDAVIKAYISEFNTGGLYEINNKTIKLFIDKKLKENSAKALAKAKNPIQKRPIIRSILENSYSLTETYFHEQVHHVVEYIFQSKKAKGTKEYRQLKQLWLEAKKVIVAEDLLPDLTEILNKFPKKDHALVEEIYRRYAKDLYSYMFDINNLDQSLAEFIARGLTNKTLMSKLKNIKTKTEKIETTMFGKIKKFLSDLWSFIAKGKNFSEIYTHASTVVSGTTALKQDNIYSDLLNLYAKMSKTNAKMAREATLSSSKNLAAISYNAIKYIMKGSNKILSDALRLKLFNRQQKPRIKVTLPHLNKPVEVLKFTKDFLTDHETRQVLLGAILTRAHLDPTGWFATTIRDIMGPDATTKLLHQYNMQKTQNEKVTSHYQRILYGDMLEAFGGNLSVAEKKAITDVALKTDLSCLLDKYSLSSIKEFLLNEDKLTNELTSADSKIKSLVGNNYNSIMSYADILALYMRTKKGNPAMYYNSTQIAEAVLGDNPSEEIISAIDTYITLKTLKDTDLSNKVLFSSLKNEGLEYVLKLHKQYIKESYKGFEIETGELKKFVKGEKIQKGYVKSVTDNTEDVIIESISNKEALFKDGYELVNFYNGNPKYGVYKRMYVVPRYRGGSAISLGAVDVTTADLQKDMFRMLGANTNAATQVEKEIKEAKSRADKIVNTINKRRLTDAEIDSLSGDVIPERSNKNILNYTLTLNTETRENLLGESVDGLEILSVMDSNKIRKLKGAELNKDLLEFLKEDAKENMGTNNYHKILGVKYIKLEKNSTDTFIREVWDKLPTTFKEELKYHDLYIREDWKLPLLGSPSVSAIDNKYLKKLSPHIKKIIVMAEQLTKMVTRQTKNVIILFTPEVLAMNMVSNFLLSVLTGNNPVKVLKYYITGFREITAYREDKKKLALLQAKHQAGLISKKDEKLQYTILKDNITNNPIAPLMDSGIDQAIIEDLDSNDIGTAFIRKKINNINIVKKTPKAVKTVLNELYLGEGTFINRVMNRLTQYSDLVARVAEYKIAMDNFPKDKKYIAINGKEKKETKEFIKYQDKIITELRYKFINYDLPQSSGEQYLNDMGITMFTKYRKRIQWVLSNAIIKNPVNAILMYLGTEYIDVDTPMEETILNKPLWNNFYNPIRVFMDAITPGSYHLVQELM